MAMVVVWNLNELHIRGPHALYVKSFQKQENGILKGEYIFDCINSWGRLDKTPIIHQREVRDLYYVALYSESVPSAAEAAKTSDNNKDPRRAKDPRGGQGHSIVQKFSGNNSTNMGGNMVFGNSTTHYHNK